MAILRVEVFRPETQTLEKVDLYFPVDVIFRSPFVSLPKGWPLSESSRTTDEELKNCF